MQIRILEDKETLGIAAADKGADIIRKTLATKGSVNIIIATGASQFAMLSRLVAANEIDWSCVTMFHLDEYIGIPKTHPASFCKYVKERFIQKLPSPIKKAYFVEGDTDNANEVCAILGGIISQHPIDVAFIGIGENAHVAFNDPPANITTHNPYIIVKLDETCRKQQLSEGWFSDLNTVPVQAISMSLRHVLKSKIIICAVPDARKAKAVRDTVEGPLTPLCPASMLRLHLDCHLFLDPDSASLLSSLTIDMSHL